MIVTDVIYRGFESDWEWLAGHPDSEYHELDGEVKLLTDAGAIVVSWAQWGDGARVLTSQNSFFLPDAALIEKVMANHALWSDLIGQNVSLDYRDSGKLCLQIHTSQTATFICAYQDGLGWGTDTLRVAREIPEGLTNANSTVS